MPGKGTRRLQKGGQVNTVAMLYPIESMQAGYTMNWEGDPYLGGPTWEKNNYMRLGQDLIREANVDFTFLHPEVLTGNCRIEEGALCLQTSAHFQQYRVVILPGMKAISLAVLQKLEAFVKAGGTLVAVSELPSRSVEKGMDGAVVRTVEALFGVRQIGMQSHEKRHENGGRCDCLPARKKEALREILMAQPLDTKVLSPVSGLQYIHKREKEEVWYFAAILQDADTEVRVQGKWNFKAEDPATGKRVPLQSAMDGKETQFSLRLKKGDSVLIIGSRTDGTY